MAAQNEMQIVEQDFSSKLIHISKIIKLLTTTRNVDYTLLNIFITVHVDKYFEIYEVNNRKRQDLNSLITTTNLRYLSKVVFLCM